MTKKANIATEQRSLDQILDELPSRKKFAEVVFNRLDRIRPLPEHPLVLDVGASGGDFLAVCHQLGYRCEGVEPWGEARANAQALGEHIGVPISIKEGTAESIPFADNTFDVVHAKSVMEHVVSADDAFREIYRVLKPGGVFWFNTASAMCPRQAEIRGFPAFGWYPNALKLKIMNWAKENRPHLIGYTQMPAIHWFTPWKARRLLGANGFQQIYDRWDLRLEEECSGFRSRLLRVIRSSSVTKIAADIVVSGCSYAAVK